MKWRDLLNADLVSLFRRDKEPVTLPPIWKRLFGGGAFRRSAPTGELPVRRVRVRKGWRGPRYLSGRRWRRDLATVTRELRGIIDANADLPGGLNAASWEAPKRRLADVLAVLRDDVASGQTLAQAMRKRPRFYPRFYADMVEAGERTGQPGPALAEVAGYLAHAGASRDTFLGWVAYVLLLLGFQTVILTFLVLKVFPVNREILADFSGGLPAPFRMVTAVAGHLAAHWPWYLAGAVGLVLAWSLLRRLRRRRGAFDLVMGGICGWIPILRTLVIKRDLGHAATVLATLLAAGVPLDDALASAATLDLNPLYARMLTRVRACIQRGEPFAAALEREPHHLVPASFRGLAAAGERAGLLPELLDKLGRFYLREVLKTRRMMARSLAPLLLMLPACVVLLIATAWFTAYTALVSAILGQM